jgi:phospholipid-binding lipoprotein MlaA
LGAFRVGVLFLAGLVLAGCATAADPQGGDPLEPMNRLFFKFNHELDRRAAVPAASFYRSAVPAPVREGLHNFLANTGAPVTFVNDVLQGETQRAGETAKRFAVNTTIGLLGFVDEATAEKIPDHREDFGQTLAVYGVPGGPYLVLPFLGPILPRDLAARYVDHYFNPLSYVSSKGKTYWGLGVSVISLLDVRSRNLESLRSIERSSVDLYASTRSLYLQHREAEIRNGRKQGDELPDF